MKHMFVLAAVLILTASVGAAAMVDCPSPPPPAQTTDTDPPGGASSFTFSCGGLTFDNFRVVQASGNFGGQTASVDLVSAQFDGSQVVLNFNPNLNNPNPTAMDLWFFFQVTGGVTAIDLATGGTLAHIIERACDAPMSTPACDAVSNGGTVLGAIDAFSNQTRTMSGPFPSTSPIFIFKDINVGANGGLTFFSQSFQTAVPEPLSLALMGSGLLALGLWRRKSPKT